MGGHLPYIQYANDPGSYAYERAGFQEIPGDAGPDEGTRIQL